MSSLAEPLDLPHWSYSHRRPVLGWIILLAVLIHGILLLIPRQPRSTGSLPQTVQVELEQIRPAARPETPVIPKEMPEPPPLVRPDEPVEAIETPLSKPAVTEESAEASPATPPVTAAILLDQVREQDWTEPNTAARSLGVPDIPDLPPNLSRPILPLQETVFGPVYITGRQEIIDQWIEPSGVVNAVIKTPNGEILCGSLQPWDPMNPLFEPVAMYRPCGGGGRRKPGVSTPFQSRD
jgi:hypothetical protein